MELISSMMHSSCANKQNYGVIHLDQVSLRNLKNLFDTNIKTQFLNTYKYFMQSK